MMARRIMAVLSVMIVALFAVAFAAQANDYSNSAHATLHYTGKIVGIDPASKVLTVQAGPKDEAYFELRDDASVKACDKELSFRDLKVGDTVSITYFSDSLGGTRMATEVEEAGMKC